ncbi:MAG: dTDP-Rha--alpha-D-GlcNAc-pyrophosphate polyprenol alpha-3-L-rhamnosyltransferase [Flavobacteriales bacterium]|nr:MAG: dTDP-Rha--alpha-D-GlcNAc-pyrophosphate polyprenol alpha-3-L-rhamnosyltransferase [Flavobacteriales bacterium]
MSKKVAVVILNWNGKKFLEQFLPSVTKHSTNAQIIIIDNYSTDDSTAFIRTNYPEVRLVLLDKNYGFSGGYNKGLKQIDSEYFVLLNSDVEVTENWLTPMIKLLDSDLSIAACQSKIKDFNNKSYFEYAGASGGFIDKYGYPFCRGRIFETLEEDKNQYDDAIEIFWASGACLFIRSEQYHNIGGLDEFFFAHMEEIDLCWRLKNEGYKIMVCPSSTVYHVGGATLNKVNPQKTFLNFRNSLLTLHKNLPKKNRFGIIFTRLCLDGIAGMKFLISGKPNHTWAIVRSHFSFYSAISQNKTKRKQANNPNLVGIINKSVVKAYFLKKCKTFNTFVK